MHDFRAGLARCQRGNVSILFAFLLIVIIGAVGVAVDFSRRNNYHSAAQDILDAAVLAAIHEETLTDAQAKFDRALLANSSGLLSQVVFAAQIDSFDGETLIASGSLSFPLTFAAIFGSSTMGVDVESRGKRGGEYKEIYIAVDFSSSLGVAATEQDRIDLEALTQPFAIAAYGANLPQGCAFGCHRREGWEPANKTVYEMARDAGIRLREDELLDQFDGLVDLLLDPTDPAVQSGMREVSIVGFSGYAQELIAPSTSSADVKASLASFPDFDRFETRFVDAFNELSLLLGVQGNGTQANPRKMLVLITDGIESRDAFFAQDAIDVSLCSAIKDSGIRIAVVELKYPKLLLNNLYDDTVLPVETAISPAMVQCASAGWYFQATNNDDVPIKFSELTETILYRSIRLVK